MKSILQLTLALAISSPSVAHAQTGGISPYQQLLPSSGVSYPRGSSILADPFVPGGLMVGSSSSILRLKPNDPNWTTFDLVSTSPGFSWVYKLAFNPLASDRRVYAAGSVQVSTGTRKNDATVNRWLVRSSASGHTGSWVDEDTFGFSAWEGTGKNRTLTPQVSQARGVTADDGGIVYSCGIAYDGDTYHSVIRRKIPGKSWETACDVKGALGVASRLNTLALFPGTDANSTPAIFAVGIFNDRWVVLRSQQQREWGSWFAVGEWPGDGTVAEAFDAFCDNNGNVYVGGVRGKNGANEGWVLRRSSDGGESWETLLDELQGTKSWLSCVTVDGFGIVTVTGNIPSPAGSPRWVVVRNHPDQTWADSWALREYPFGDTPASPGKVIADLTGHVFMMGSVAHNGGYALGLLRRAP